MALTPKEVERAMASCPHPAGSKQRVETYRLRAELGIDLFSPVDASDVVKPTTGSEYWLRFHKGKIAPPIRCYEVVSTPKYFELRVRDA